MKIFESLASYSHMGRREYQEDNYAYGEDFILVSDGVGGLAKGNIASEIVIKTWQEALSSKTVKPEEVENQLQILTDHTIQELNDYADANPDSMGMGATIACFVMIEHRCFAIHIGDSRIYHFDNKGSLKWRSKDHSFVQELIDAEVITEEQAIGHPRKNVITRVLQAKKGHEVKASISLLQNIMPEDHIMVCTDGVVESWTDQQLEDTLRHSASVEEFLEIIKNRCIEHSSDNNTAVVSRLGDAVGIAFGNESAVASQIRYSVAATAADTMEKENANLNLKNLKPGASEVTMHSRISKAKSSNAKKLLKRYFPVMILLVTILLTYPIWNKDNTSGVNDEITDDKIKPVREVDQKKNINTGKDNIKSKNKPITEKEESSFLKEEISNEVGIMGQEQYQKQMEEDDMWRRLQSGDPPASKKEVMRFIKSYPESRHIDEARKMLEEIQLK